MAKQHSYELFGLTIGSEIELPELRPADFDGPYDVEIALGRTPEPKLLEEGYLVSDAGAGFMIDAVAAYWVSGGSRILVDPDAKAPQRNVRLYLLGSAMGMLLHQRGLLPLHANAIEIDSHAIAFMGPSGAGKSTLAAWFHDHGYRVLSDDVCAVGFEQGLAVVRPGLSRLRLWDDALAVTGRDEAGFARSFAGDEDYRKFDVPIAVEEDDASLTLAAVYVLERGDNLDVIPLHGAEAIEAVFANTYRGQFVHGAGASRTHWEACVMLVRTVKVFRLTRPWGHDLLDDQIAQIQEHVRSSTVPLR